MSVDDRPVVQLGFNGAVQRIRGPEGSCVPLTVRKASDQQVAQVVVCRRRVSG
jgi:C-terminal processing protease CtpA/Prc